MYKIVQNYESLYDEYEYAHEYVSIADAMKDVDEYYTDDKSRGVWHSYTIVDENGDDINSVRAQLFNDMARGALRDIGLTDDECERELDDFYQLYG